MTVRLETKINRYVGLSSDPKPTPGEYSLDISRALTAEDVPVGSTFLEADTEEIWHWTGWEWRLEDTREVRELKASNSLLSELIVEFRTLRHALVLTGMAEDIDEPIKD